MAPDAKHMKDIDQGWAWWVLFASYLNLLLCSGLSYVAGMFQVVFLQEFHGSVALTSWVTSLFSSFMQLGGPMSSFLANVVSCRAAVMVGGLCLSLGLAFSALQNSLGMLFAFFGIIAGVGLGLTYTASVVVINYYFQRKRTMVTGIALSSGGLGIMLGPQISTFLFQTFSWREALWAMSVASAQVCVLGALMFPMHEAEKSPLVDSLRRALKWLRARCGLAHLFDCHRKRDRGRHKDQEIGVTSKLVRGGDNPESERELCPNGDTGRLDGDSGIGSGGNGLQSIQNVLSGQSENTTTGDGRADSLMNPFKQVLRSESELFSAKPSPVETAKEDNFLYNIHMKHIAGENLAHVSNSTSSLRERSYDASQQRQPHYHHYFLVQHRENHNHIPQCADGTHSHSNLHHSRAHPKSQSFFELSMSSNSNTNDQNQQHTISKTFRSNRELCFTKQTGSQSDLKGRTKLLSRSQSDLKGRTKLLSANGINLSEKQIHSAGHATLFASSPAAKNLTSSECRKSETSSITAGSCERLGHVKSMHQPCFSSTNSTVMPEGSTSRLHLTVVPHNPSLLSLVASTQQLDLFLHQEDQPSSKENLIDTKHPLHKGLFGIDLVTSSDLNNSQMSLKPTDAVITDVSPEEIKMASSSLSLAHAHNHISGKDPNRPLYHNGAFMLLCLQLFIANCACGVFNIHMPSFSISKGLTDQEMTNILSINGLALFNGRMLVGALASATGLDLLIYWALHMIGGFFIIILPVAATSYLNFCFLIYGVGTFFGSVYSVLTSLTLKYVGLSRLATAFGLEMVCAGLGYLLAPPVAGLLVDLTGSYDYDMYCGGALLILSAVLVMLLPVLEPEVTREDLRRFFEGDNGLSEGQSHGGNQVDVEIEDCGDCHRDCENDASAGGDHQEGTDDNREYDDDVDADNIVDGDGAGMKLGKMSVEDNIC